jgi:hypothetical protein
MRTWIILFWVFIVGMLLWQFYDYNDSMTRQAIEHPQQTQFFFYHTNAAVAPAAPIEHKDAFVEQTKFTVEENVPGTGSFTCNVTATNNGQAKAKNVQIKVRPYRGVRTDDDDDGPNTVTITTLSDNDPQAQINQWVSFPDLAPGESNTQSVVFLASGNYSPGKNPKPEVVFETDKSQGANAPVPSP